jgi:hypothetical protein
MTAEGKVAVGDVVEDQEKINVMCRVIDLLRITHPPTSSRFLTNTNIRQAEMLTSGGLIGRSVLTS